MSLASRLTTLVQAIGADIKTLMGTRPLAAVDVVATGNVNIASAPGSTAWDGSSVTWATGRALLVNQTDKTQNGIWLFIAPGQPLQRAPDAPTIKTGQTVYVRSGATYGGRTFVSTKDVSGAGQEWGFQSTNAVDFEYLQLRDETRYWSPITNVQTSNINIAAPVIAFNPPMPFPANGDTILLRGQTDKTQNGLWVYNGSGTPLVRSPEADTSSEFTNGKLVWDQAADNIYQYVGPTGPTLGATELTFAFASANRIIKDLWGIDFSLTDQSNDIAQLVVDVDALQASDSGVARAGVIVKGQRVANTSVGSTYVGPVGFDEVKDVGDAWNGSRFQPKVPGTYTIRTMLSLQQPSTGLATPEVYLCKNAPNAPTPTQIGAAKVGVGFAQTSGTWAIALVEQQVELNGTTDYVEVFMWTQSGATIVFSGFLSTFSAELVGASATNPARRIKGRIDLAGAVATSANPALYSVVRNGVGDYTVTLTSPMSARPNVQATPLGAATNCKPWNGVAPTASVIRFASFVEDPTTGIVMTDGSFEFTLEEYGLGLQATMDIEPWKLVNTNGSTFGANIGHWGNGSVVKFRKDPMGKVHVAGRLSPTGAIAQLSTLLTLPLGYRPALNDPEGFFCTGSINGAVTVFDNGVFRWEGATMAAGSFLYLSPISYFAG